MHRGRRLTSLVWTALLLWGAVGNAASATGQNRLSIPQLTTPPTLDGDAQHREWADAALLPPLGRLPNGGSDGHNTHIYLGWHGESLYVAVRCDRSPQAVSAGKSDDHLELILGAKTFAIGPGRTPTGRNTQARVTETGWEAEAQIPLAAIRGKGELALKAILREPSIGLTSAPLTQLLTFSERRIACRFTETGEFSQGKHQGAELELINAAAADVKGDVTLVLSTGGKEVARVEEKDVIFRADSNNRFRVVAPWLAGVYDLAYEVKADGDVVAVGQLRFDSGGPMRVALVPFYLWRDGVFVRIEVLNSKPADVTLKVLHASGNKTLFETTMRTGDDGKGEGFVSTKAVRPGPYLVRVEARQEGEKLAVCYLRVPGRPSRDGFPLGIP